MANDSHYERLILRRGDRNVDDERYNHLSKLTGMVEDWLGPRLAYSVDEKRNSGSLQSFTRTS